MIAALSDLALLLSFVLLAGRWVQPATYAAQCLVIALATISQSVQQADWTLLIVAVLVLGQGALLWLDRPSPALRTSFPVATLCAAVLLVVLATVSAPTDGLRVPLAIVLLGLLGAASMPGPYGVLSLLNGVILAMTAVAGLPLRPITTLALSVLAIVVTRGAVPMRWVRR